MRTYRDDERHWRAYQPFLPEPWRPADDDQLDEERWAWSGLDVHLDRFPRPGAALSAIVLHGGGGYGRVVAPLGRLLHDAGAEAVMPDLPGYGLTTVAPRRFTYDTWVALVGALVGAERARGRRVVLAGASIGGLLAWHVAAAAPPGSVAGVIATTLIDPRDPVVRRAVSRWPGSGALMRLGAPLDPVRVPLPLVVRVQAMSNDPTFTRVFLTDRLGGGNRVPIRFLRSWMRYRPALEPERWDRGPVLLVHPGADAWTPTALSRRFFDRLPEPKRLVELPNCGHMPVEEPGVTVLADEVRRFVAGLTAAAVSGA